MIHYFSFMKVKVSQSCLTLCDPVDYTVHGILQARMPEWVAFPFSRGSSQPMDGTRFPALQADSLPVEPQGKPNFHYVQPLIRRPQSLSLANMGILL